MTVPAEMSNDEDSDIKYRCVRCDSYTDSLYRSYGKHALRLTQCNVCGSIADKYIEFDPFIIIIDLILLSKDAHRHVLYNTDFKAFWRLFIILIAVETYMDWSDLYSTGHKELYNSQNVSHSASKFSQDTFPNNMDEENLFQFGKIFICSLIETMAFIGIIFSFSLYFGLLSFVKGTVDYLLIWKAFTLASIGKFLLFPVLIWGNDQELSKHCIILVFVYITLSLVNVLSVIFRCSKMKSFAILTMSYIIKVMISFQLYSIDSFLSKLYA